MKALLIAILFLAPFAAGAQNAGSEARSDERRAAQKSCDELVGQAKEACLKQGGTVKANTAAGGSAAKPQTKRPARPDARKDYPARDSK